jgi:hypothetical protein
VVRDAASGRQKWKTAHHWWTVEQRTPRSDVRYRMMLPGAGAAMVGLVRVRIDRPV